jgi:hypothetical protein
LDLDIDLNQAFGKRIDLDQTRVYGAREFAKLGDQTDISLRYRFVWVRANDTAGNGTDETDAGAKAVDCAEVRGAKDKAGESTNSSLHTSHERLPHCRLAASERTRVVSLLVAEVEL